MLQRKLWSSCPYCAILLIYVQFPIPIPIPHTRAFGARSEDHVRSIDKRTTELTMFMYGLTLQKASSVVQAIHGNFSGAKLQEIVIAKGKILEIYRVDPNTGKLHSVLSAEVFGLVRSIIPFRLTGSTKGR